MDGTYLDLDSSNLLKNDKTITRAQITLTFYLMILITLLIVSFDNHIVIFKMPDYIQSDIFTEEMRRFASK